MMNTLQLGVILSSLVGQLNEAFKGIKSDFVLLKTQYTFPGNASICKRAEWSKSFPTGATIATYQNQTFRIGEDFREEFTWKENHPLLNSAKFTDSGQYVFVCDGDKNPFILDVLYAIDVHAAEMDNITLNCHADNTKDATWLHNNERVLQYKKDGSKNPGKGYEGRVSLEKNCFKTGDFSLTIAGVRKTDAGIYRCFVDDEAIKGYPHTYNLSRVNEKRSSPEDQTNSNYNEAQTLNIYKALTIVFIIISCILILVIVILVRYYQSTSATATYHVPNRDENDCVLLDNTTSPKNDSQSMVNHPVQESDTTDNKPSNTMPF
ncbi:uncharacterized protein LOC143715375 [Siphateles boraxobius]|uniref:uncharacterized protein LOC143715375 n=1 Tax=Siphateles boraxobius TaxID=180520 RepID=UPI004064108B